MYIISHRGNINGISKETENKYSQIIKCLNLGFDVEIDLRFENNKFFLGHDYAQYEISLEKLFLIKDNLWIHCKDVNSLDKFCTEDYGIHFNFFWHEKDSYTLTSKGYIWAYPGTKLTKKSINVLPELNGNNDESLPLVEKSSISGICSDYPYRYKKIKSF
tara:strand:+ start:3056 stop:3538 length:483 start_codon:yes stop_codon:yes gene_type:complete